jgi:hypothetical protein
MTDTQNPGDQQPGNIQQSLSLLADRKELLRLRLLPVELAIVLSVSKQTISRWIAEGKITPPSPIDGRLDAQAATRQVLRNTPPSKIRARILRQAVDDAQALRDGAEAAEARAVAATARAEAADAALQEAQESIVHRDGWIESAERAAAIWKTMVIDAAAELRSAATADWPAILTRLELDADEAADAQPDPDEAADAQPDPADTLDVGPLDLELDATLADDWAAFNVRLPPPRRELSSTDGERGE